MERLEDKLKQLVEQACGHPSGSLQRSRLLTQIIRLCSHKLWKEHTPYYQDALQQTWIYFCSNLCESTTTKAYDPSISSVTFWLNTYLRYKLRDLYIEQQRVKAKTVSTKTRQSTSGEVSETEIIDSLPASPDVPPILEDVRMWAETDSDGELRHTHIQGRPDINCQMLILKRLPPEVGWKELAEEYNLTVSTLSSFYQRQCLPRLRKFAEKEGYL
ncbi:MAG: sigma-70 family RNA polymerase sigma factor [Scytonematopsis contorta HA4267-MV1]|jgi:hypothetical protein|nr:sigma-70 family RNA polymerase sigma factor [Scytonematopsis contorta HA4267-MV1]